MAYAVLVVRRARQQSGYEPVLEDWLWHAVFPFIAHVAFLTAAVVLPRDPEPALFAIGAAVLLLLFIGIHNAWDAVTYVALERWQKLREPGDTDSPRAE